MLFSGCKWAVSVEPGGVYSLHVWQCWFSCLLQITVSPLPAGVSLLSHSSSGIARCIFAVVQQAHPFCFFAPSVSHSACFSGLKDEGSSYSKCRLDEKEFFSGGGQVVAQEKYGDNVNQHERLVSEQLQARVLAFQRFVGTYSQGVTTGEKGMKDCCPKICFVMPVRVLRCTLNMDTDSAHEPIP